MSLGPGSAVGETFTLRTEPITRTQIVRFAGAAGDFNPLHHDEAFARDSGQPTVFAMGQLAAGLLARMASDWLGGHSLRSLSVRFTAKVWPGDVLTLQGVVEDVGERGVERYLSCGLTATNQDGETVATGTATARERVNER